MWSGRPGPRFAVGETLTRRPLVADDWLAIGKEKLGEAGLLNTIHYV